MQPVKTALTMLLAVPVLLAAPAMAQTPAQTAAATSLVDVLQPPARTKAMLDQQIAAIREGRMIRGMLGSNAQFRTEAAKNQPAFNAAIARMGAAQAKALGPIFTEMQAAQRRTTIDAYARAFTVAELGQMTAFYRTPTGAKLLVLQPGLSAGIGQQMQTQFGPRIEAANKALAPQVQAELRKLFPKADGAPK